MALAKDRDVPNIPSAGAKYSGSGVLSTRIAADHALQPKPLERAAGFTYAVSV
jgi:hypothetical protein